MGISSCASRGLLQHPWSRRTGTLGRHARVWVGGDGRGAGGGNWRYVGHAVYLEGSLVLAAHWDGMSCLLGGCWERALLLLCLMGCNLLDRVEGLKKAEGHVDDHGLATN